MKSFIIFELIVYLNIYCTVWAQTSNSNETQPILLSGNTEPIPQTTTQTPKSTEYDTTSAENLNSINTTLSQMSSDSSESTIGLTNAEPNDTNIAETNAGIVDNETQNINSGNMSSNSANTTESDALHTQTETPVPINPITSEIALSSEPTEPSMHSIQSFNSTESPVIESSESIDKNETKDLTTLNTTTPSDAPEVLSNETQESNTTNNSLTKISESNEHLNSFSNDISIQTTKSSVEPIDENELKTNATNITLNSTENSSEKTMTTTDTPIVTTLKMITTETPIVTTLKTSLQTNADNLYIPTIFRLDDNEINSNQNQSENNSSAEVSTENTYFNASDIKGSTREDRTLFTNTQELGVNSMNTSLDSEGNTHSIQITQTTELKETQNQTTEKYETASPIGTVVSQTNDLNRTTESIHLNISIESKPTTHSPQTTRPEETTDSQTISSMHFIITSKAEDFTTDPSQQSITFTESQEPITERFDAINENITGMATNDSEPIIDSKTTFTQPLTDHSLKTTEPLKPITTSIPYEPNISAITLTLPTIRHINYITKEDVVNIVTITFRSTAIDIFHWISINDRLFRNFTCNCVDPERNWCTIDRVIYVSPSPLVMNNLLIINFFIDDSTDNDLTNSHVFAGTLTVGALKNSTSILEKLMDMEVISLQTNLGTVVVKPLVDSPDRLAKFEVLVFVFTTVMFICVVLISLAIICNCAKRKSVDMNQIELYNAGRRQTTSLNGGFDLNSASNILREENEKCNHNVISLEDGWVAPIDHVIENEKLTKYDNLQDTKL